MRYTTMWTRLVAPLLSALVGASLVGIAAQKTASKPLAGYKEIVVEKFVVRTLAEKEQFPSAYAGVMQKTTVAKLLAGDVFGKVIDASELPAEDRSQPASGERLVLSGEVIGYEKGSRAARVLVGFGAGQTKLTTRFIFRDASTGQEVFRTERVGTFKGMSDIGGGSERHGLSEAARKTVEGLIQEIKRNR